MHIMILKKKKWVWKCEFGKGTYKSGPKVEEMFESKREMARFYSRFDVIFNVQSANQQPSIINITTGTVRYYQPSITNMHSS